MSKSKNWQAWRNTKRPLPKVFIPEDVFRRLTTYVGLAKGEISGLGNVEVWGTDLLITDVFLFEQVCNSTHTSIKTADISSFLTQAVMDGRDTSTLKLWWHSHVNMSCFWSSEDEATARGLANGVWYLSLVLNKRSEYLCRLDLFDPVPVTLDELALNIVYPEDQRLKNQLQAEINRKVTFVTYRPPSKIKAKGNALPEYPEIYDEDLDLDLE